MVQEAVVAVIARDGRVLYVERGPAVPWSGYWTPPSGSVEPGETQAEAVAREVREELGVEVAPLRKVWECPSHDGRYRLHWWLAELTEGEPRPDGAEVAKVAWVRPGELPGLTPNFEDDLRFFREVWPAQSM